MSADAQKDVLAVPVEDKAAPGWGEHKGDQALPNPGQDVDAIELGEATPVGYEFTRRDGSHSR